MMWLLNMRDVTHMKCEFMKTDINTCDCSKRQTNTMWMTKDTETRIWLQRTSHVTYMKCDIHEMWHAWNVTCMKCDVTWMKCEWFKTDTKTRDSLRVRQIQCEWFKTQTHTVDLRARVRWHSWNINSMELIKTNAITCKCRLQVMSNVWNVKS